MFSVKYPKTSQSRKNMKRVEKPSTKKSDTGYKNQGWEFAHFAQIK